MMKPLVPWNAGGRVHMVSACYYVIPTQDDSSPTSGLNARTQAQIYYEGIPMHAITGCLQMQTCFQGGLKKLFKLLKSAFTYDVTNFSILDRGFSRSLLNLTTSRTK